ncbi:M28 family peptidase [Pseudoxanthomonas sp.]|uniref:M28 family peptidase n=1 Tax=Pseudoxanthomonas sp. TaxID=1871049 RepID=UPI0026049DCB|nr:M28 family peptidase [Pseudoxanthomonas sp.]WDS37073.1 MAG: M28 family peptidase [Pseudoxanthomonas sp.]
MRASLARLLGIGLTACLSTTAIAAATSADTASADAPYGFLGSHGQRLATLESDFDAQVKPAQIDAWLQQLTSAPNHLGSPHNLENARFIAARFKEWGFQVRTEKFEALVAYPLEQHLQLVRPNAQEIDLAEPPVPGDASTAITEGTIPGAEAYSPDGDVTAPLVYVNQGIAADYEELARRGVDVKGKIVIARSTGSGRMFKPLLAEQHGAVATIIFSDPIEDGYTKGDVYPAGAWRPERGVQRGTLIVKDALDRKAGDALIRNKRPENLNGPVLAISYAAAKPLLSALQGPTGPANWQGGLPITYHLGGQDSTQVRVKTRSDWGWRTLYNVIATLPGSEHPEQEVIRGVHHDAWVFGAWDPLANTAAMLAEAQAISALHRAGWTPKRTLRFASWDGEELGLLGSRWHVQQDPDGTAKRVVFYLNGDTTSRGYLSIGGSPAMSTLLHQVAAGIKDPETGVSIAQRLRGKQAFDAAKADPSVLAPDKDALLEPLTSGSDFSSFVHKLGVMSMHSRFGYDRDGDEESVPIYHSAYDTYAHYQRFGDPGMAYLQALAQVNGHLLLRVADADLLPWHYAELADALDGYVDAIERDNTKQEVARRQRQHLLELDAYRLAADPSKHVGNPPPLPAGLAQLDLTPLRAAVAALHTTAAQYDQAYDTLDSRVGKAQLATANRHLAVLEQHFIVRKGKQSRTLLYAGAGEPFPEIRKAVQTGDAQATAAAINEAAAAVKAAAAELSQATQALEAGRG